MVEGDIRDEHDSDKMWRCSACGAEFEPDPSDYSCPVCQSNATAPLDNRERFERARRSAMEEKQRNMGPERPCPECGTTMRMGYLVERDPLLEAMVLGREIYWSPNRSSEVTLNAYACPFCGRVCLCVRKLEADRDTILKAPTRKTTA